MIDYSSRVGETNVANNGLKMTIIAYNGYDNINVKFEDGTTARTTYNMFKKGFVRNRNAKNFTNKFKRARDKYLGMKVKTLWGTCKVVDYNGSSKITVEFEDGARKIVDSKSLSKGEIRHPNANSDLRLTKNKLDRVGKESCNKDGYKAKIVDYITARKFIVEFENGERVELHNYTNFINGKFISPLSRVGEESTMTNGLKCKIISYKDYRTITVQFENGVIRDNISYSSFKRGNVALPVEHVGEKLLMNNGVEAEIVDFKGSLDISIKFEDGTILDNKQYSAFVRGGIGHPTISNSTGKGSLGSFTLFKRAYKYDNNVYYNCKCSKCLLHDILTPHEMLVHVCN